MKIDFTIQEKVINQEVVPIKFVVTELHKDATKAKVFVNGQMHAAIVKDGAFKAEIHHFLEYGDNRIQVDITCKGEYAQFVTNVLNQHRYLLEYFGTKNSISIDDGKKTRIIDCVEVPMLDENTAMNVDLFRYLGGDVGFNTTDDGGAWCSVMLNGNSVVFFSGAPEININGKTKNIQSSPKFIRGQMYIPVYGLESLADWLTVTRTADGFKLEVIS